VRREEEKRRRERIVDRRTPTHRAFVSVWV
jgi:hypothetical protein